VMRSIPGITVISPADSGETVKATLAALKHPESIYIRLTGGMGNPIVYKDDYEFQIGKAIELREGNDVTLIAAGTMVYESLEAAKLLEEENISASVVNMHTIKPIDVEAIERACRNTKCIVTVEEHNVVGGLGSAVAEYKATIPGAPPQMLLGLPDKFGKSGEYRDLLEQYQLTAPQIAKRVLGRLKELT